MKNYKIKLEQEIEKAQKLVEEAIKNCDMNDCNSNSYQYYQQRVEYVKGLQRAKELLEVEI